MAAASTPDNKLTEKKSSGSSLEGYEDGLISSRSSDKPDFVGNISNYTALPEGYRGPLAKGHLIFDACFEGGATYTNDILTLFVSFLGNLGRVDYISHFEYDLFVRPDTCNPKFVLIKQIFDPFFYCYL